MNSAISALMNGAIGFDNVVHKIESATASMIVWLDCLITNVDRTCRNTNLLMWKKELWLIDHGAALFFHHSWDDWETKIERPFGYIKDHCLLASALALQEADNLAHQKLSAEKIAAIIHAIPEEWLQTVASPFNNIDDHRQAYIDFLQKRFAQSSIFVNAAIDEREKLI